MPDYVASFAGLHRVIILEERMQKLEVGPRQIGNGVKSLLLTFSR